MEISAFSAYCPYEIGDKIQVFGKEMRIVDIMFKHYEVSGKVEFAYRLDNYRWYNLEPGLCLI